MKFEQIFLNKNWKKQRITIIFLLLICSIFDSFATESDFTYSTQWSAAQAESIHNLAQRKQLESTLSAKSPLVNKQMYQKIIKQQTNFGQIPHASKNTNKFNGHNNLPNLVKLHQAFLKSHKIKALPNDKFFRFSDAFFSSYKNHLKAAVSVTSTINKYDSTPAASSGYVYIYEYGTNTYLDYSPLNNSGQITYQATIGQKVNIVFYPYDSSTEAIQVLASVDVAQNLTLTLERAYEFTVNLKDHNNQPLSNLSGKIAPTLKGFYDFNGPDLPITNGSATVYLTANGNYTVKIAPDVPYLVKVIQATNGASNSSTDAIIEQGLSLEININDLNNLIGVNGCILSGSVNVVRSYNGQNISNFEEKRDGSNNLVGFFVSVLDNDAVDITVRFDDYNANFCKIQDVKLKRRWFATTAHELSVDLIEKPLPHIIFVDENDNPLTYSLGSAYNLNSGESLFFNTSFPPSLIAGQTYAANLNKTGYSTNETLFTAQSGNFDIHFLSKQLTTIKSKITIGTANRINGLIELSQAGELVQAYEYRDREVSIEVPVGTYDIRVSGLTAQNGTQAIVLKPFETTKIFTSLGAERLDFNLTIPNTGISFSIPFQDINMHLTFFEGVLPVATKMLYPGYSNAILSDFPTLDFTLRSSGFNDTSFSITPTTALPVLDIIASQNSISRLSGNLLDANNQPISGTYIVMYFENGIDSSFVGQTNANGFYNIPKLKNGLVQFLAPDNNDSIQKYVPITDPNTTTTLDIVLPDVQFASTTTNSEDLQLLHGDGQHGFQIVFLAESYTNISETFTDSNSNGVWDGILYIDVNNNGVWDFGGSTYESAKAYGDRVIDYVNGPGTDISSSNEAFVDSNGDEYPNINDYDVFVQNAKNYIRALLSVPIIAENIDFDAYILFKPSNQAGQDIIDTDNITIVNRDTRFGAQVTLDRSLLSIDYTLANQTLDAVAPERDLTVVMINQPVFIGRANSFILANGGIGNSQHNSATPGHEFGHNPGGLLDEYNEFDGTSQRYFSPQFHMSHSTLADSISWFADIGSRFDLPVSVPYSFGEGVFAGGNLNAGGAYRSTSNSRMRNNAPEYNNASIAILSHSFCLNNLTPTNFLGGNNNAPNSDIIFTHGFEQLATSGIIPDYCP